MTGNRLCRLLYLVGRILSPVYSVVMRLRAALYALGVLPSARLGLPVVSVGNLTMGGTGKTPMVIYLSRLIARHGRRPGVVSRGYGGRNRLPVALVSDGKEVLLPPAEAGDEPVLLGRSLPGVPVVISRKRSDGGEYLSRRNLADTVILDDGFQHLAVHRDLDIVLFAAGVALWSEWVFPGGVLREPVSALTRADCFVMTGVKPGGDQGLTPLRSWLTRVSPGTPVFVGEYEPVALYDHNQRRHPFEGVAGVPLFAFCGIANPESFRRTLEGKFLIKGFRVFPDHHVFRADEIAELARQARVDGCAGLITTEKDYVKLRSLELELPIWVVAVELRMEQAFDDFVLDKLARCK